MKLCDEVHGKYVRTLGHAGLFLVLGAGAAYGQSYDITPLVGGMFGGTIKLEELNVPNFHAHLEDRLSFGIAGGVRFDGDDCPDCDVIEFRWMRQNTHLSLHQDPLVVQPLAATVFHPAVTLDEFLGDFTREIPIKEKKVRPFVTASLGASLMSAPAASTVRFIFGLSTGVKVFPKPHYGFRIQVEYLPMVMHAELQRVVCAGGCIVALTGGVMNQFDVMIGPAFRF